VSAGPQAVIPEPDMTMKSKNLRETTGFIAGA
jgi:hypothetical protein